VTRRREDRGPLDVDRHYADPRLAAVYDIENAGRDDTRFYLHLAAELRATRVLDLGCGTGVLARELAARGHEVTAVDPADAMLAIARSRPGADAVRWVCGTVTDVTAGAFDLALMTGHVAQVFLDDDRWRHTLRGVHDALREGGRLAFESRNPRGAPWTAWDPRTTFASFEAQDGVGAFESWLEVVEVADGRVQLRGWTRFLDDGATVSADSRLRFRTLEELEDDLDRTGFDVERRLGTWDGAALVGHHDEIILVARRRS
jgi:SAM-dependent methyltransferase